VIRVQTKSGSNEFHGSGFYYYRSSDQQARDPFTNKPGVPLAAANWKQFGGSVGGPIFKDKLFFFADYQGTKTQQGITNQYTIPTAEVVGTCNPATNGASDTPGFCNLSQYTKLTGGGLIYDPKTGNPLDGSGRTQFCGPSGCATEPNWIPITRISQNVGNVLALFPKPTVTGLADPNFLQNNFVSSGAGPFDQKSFDTRIDYSAPRNYQVFGRFSLDYFSLSGKGGLGALGGNGFGPGGLNGSSNVHNYSLATGFTKVISAKWLTDFRFGYFKYNPKTAYSDQNTAPMDTLGFPCLNSTKLSNLPNTNCATGISGLPTTGGLSGFLFSNGGDASKGIFSNFGNGLNVARCNCPLTESEQQFQFVNNWTRSQGNHTFKFGADIRRAYNLRVPSDQHRAGQLSFNAAGTQGPNGGGSGLATFMLGDVQLFQRYVSSVNDASETQNRWFFYGQDTWRVTQKLTINYGLRWELYRPQTVNGAGKGGYVDLGTGEVLIAGSQGVGTNLNVQGRFTDFAPRLGIAYQLNPKTVVRAGYGRGYDLGIFGSIFGHNVTQNLPVLGIQTLAPANNFDTVFTLAQGPTPLNPASILNSQPKGPNGRPLLPDGVTPFVISKNMRLPTVDAWNLTVQRQLTNTVSLETAYVGNKGTHVFAGTGGDYDPNQPTLVGFGTLSSNQRKPYFQKFGWSQNLRYFASDASNNYEALQIKIEKRFSQGLQVLGHYTWSRNMDFSNIYYPVDARYSYGPADNNRAHAIVIASLWEVPFGKGHKFGSNLSKPLDLLLGGWQSNGVFNWATGLPFTPSYQACNSDRDSGWCRPDVAGNWQASDPSQFGWFATSNTLLTTNGQVSGPWQRPQKGVQGNVGRNALWGPHFTQPDMSFFKTFAVTERFRVQFRAESFNFANHLNLGQPNGCVDCPGVAGRIFNAIGNYVPRQWQMATRVEF
jgi:outer membrane receptor protein involved in Fe transport